MAWLSSGHSNEALVENMYANGLITDPNVKAAFLKVDRGHYSPISPYLDCPQSIGYSATISAPHMHASAVEHLLSHLVPDSPSSSRRVLDIGSGSGYLTHILAELAGENSKVVGLEHIRGLRDLGERNMRKSTEGQHLLESGRVEFVVGDGRKGWVVDGVSNGEDYWDVIHVGASAREVHPELIRQLKAPGCIFIPVDDDTYGDSQYIWRISKDTRGEITRERLFAVRYVPLTDAPRNH